MASLTAASLRHQSRQFLAPGLAVVLGVAFVAATLVLTGTMNASIRDAVAGQYSSYSAVVTPSKGEETLPAGVADRISHTDGVANVDPVRSGSGMIGRSADASPAMITTESSLVPHPVLEGRAPQGDDEIALSETVRAGTGLEVGDTVPVQPTDGDSGSTRAKVVGVLDVSGDPRYGGGTPAVFATPKGVTHMTGVSGWDEIPVVGTDDEEATTASLTSALQAKGADVTVSTATEHADAKVAEFTGGTDFLASFFLAFAVIALFVSMIVIGNTFSILLARRARETALLRTVGATRGQVVRASLLEALVVGLVSSVVGVGVGIGLAWALIEAGSALAGDALPELVLAVPTSAVIVPVIVGVLVVLVAGVRPAVRSSRVSPLAALRPDAAVTVRNRRGLVRIAAGTDLFATLRERMASGLPVFGTCAGLILLSDRLSDDSLGGFDRLGGLDITVARNAYGRQRESFTAPLTVQGLDEPVAGTFIRAPQILDLGPEIEVLASHGDTPVLVRQGAVWGDSFHPELGTDGRIHAEFLHHLGAAV